MTNPSSTIATSTYSLTVQLPAGLQVVGGSFGSSCAGGTVVYSPASSTITHSGLTLAGGASCLDGFTLTATGQGQQTVQATVSGSGQTASASGQVSVLDVASSLSISVTPPTYQGGTFPVTVQAVDALGNADVNYTGTVHFTSTDTQATLPSDYTFVPADLGSHIFSASLGTVGSQTITATDSVSNLSVTSSGIAVSVPNLVVTTAQDDAGTAANCTVQTTPGTGTDASCSLRDALLLDASLGSGNITFDGTAFGAANTVAQNTITLGSAGTLEVPANTTITGAYSGSGLALTNRVTISGGGLYGVFSILSGTVTLNNLAIVHGNGTTGGILNYGTLTLNDCLIAYHSGSDSGGIYNLGTLSVMRSLIASNTAFYSGAGIYNYGHLSLSDSTLTGNVVMGGGGGGIYNEGTLVIFGSTRCSADGHAVQYRHRAVTLLVNQATPTVTWATPAPITYGTALSATQLNATATVAGSFAYLPAATTGCRALDRKPSASNSLRPIAPTTRR